MSEAGWYPDPQGAVGQYRYWDGAAWSDTTSPTPRAPQPAKGRGRRPWWLVLLALAVIGALLWAVFRPGGPIVAPPEDTRAPTISPWNENPTETPPPSEEGRPVACPDERTTAASGQPQNGRYSGGGLSYAEVPGWSNSFGWGVDWASDRAGQRNSVTKSWVAMTLVGAVSTEHFTSLRAATRQIMECMASSYYYQGFSGRTDLVNEPVTIDGHTGWKLTSEVRVAGRPDGVEGDVVTVIAVDCGTHGQWGIFVSEAPIGDSHRVQLVETAASSLTVVTR